MRAARNNQPDPIRLFNGEVSVEQVLLNRQVVARLRRRFESTLLDGDDAVFLHDSSDSLFRRSLTKFPKVFQDPRTAVCPITVLKARTNVDQQPPIFLVAL
jgi:hypothetical protein